MAVKLVEQAFITKFIVLYLFSLPVSLDHSNVPPPFPGGSAFEPVNFRAYSCNVERSSVLGENATSSNINPQLANFHGYNLDLPIGLGLSNQAIQGFTQTMIGQIPCNTYASQRVSMGDSAMFDLKEDPKMVYSLKEFHSQCYTPALSNLNTAIRSGEYNGGVSLNTKQRRFNSTDLIRSYLGHIPNPANGSNFRHRELTVLNDSWVNAPSSSPDASDNSTSTFQCDIASAELFSELTSYLQDSKSEAVRESARALMMYPEFDGTIHLTEGSAAVEVTDRFAHQALLDTVGNVSNVFNMVHGESPIDLMKQESGKIEQTLALAVTAATTISNNISNMTYGLLTPVLISILISVVFLSSPIILWLSGYNYKVAVMLVYMLVFLVGTMFVYEVGLYVETVILAQAFSAFSTLNPNEWANLSSLVQSSVIPSMLAIWSICGALLGILVIPMFSQLLQSFSTSIATYGIMMAMKMVSTIMGAMSPLTKAGGAAAKSALGSKK
ncbi:hypothetical protein [Vibrio agarivorans]|uniref:TraG N-terminal Proteobacteria domain-containing protein n=1 Tax=Vibrio agarivorans TaxID=153622 RepID=A0ABT7Y770_9VIBR|nr:hypothetical protein [Vibrio agarivorans]MDN2483913.1 hypothetical protein [Vibrio agarivorans]